MVDGFLNIGNDSTVITLSRSKSLSDTTYSLIPELRAQLTVIGSASDTYPLQEEGNGIYFSSQLNLNFAETYQLKIVTSNGKEYISDSIIPKQTPPIDTLTWHADSTGLSIYLNTHDPSNNARYYRWDFTETWQRQSYYNSELEYVNGQLITRPPQNQVYNCWKTQSSSNIIVNTSEKLSQDIIYQQPIQFIPMGSEQLFILYSINVRQFAITSDAYNFWQTLKSSTELTGSLFDPEPSQITGNIHCITNPAEPVLGFIGASTVSQKRIFINRYDFSYWLHYPPQCFLTLVSPGDIGAFADTLLITPINSIPAGINSSTPECSDCRYGGGVVTTKPSFWPN